MNTIRINSVCLAVLLLAAGCGRGPVLTSRQVEQVFDTQESVVEQQASLSQGRDDLEADRRQWDKRERNDPIVAESIEAAGILIACCLPLLVLVLVLAGRRPQPEEWSPGRALTAREATGTSREFIPESSLHASHVHLPER